MPASAIGSRTRTRIAYAVATEPNASNAAGAARPASTSAPAAASSTSIAVSPSARSSMVTWPMWPIRKRRETRSPWPPAMVIPCRSRSASRSATASTPSGVSAPVENGRAVVVRRVELEADRLDAGAAGASERAVTRERRLQAVGEDEAERLDQRHDERGRRRQRRRPLRLCAALARPVPVEPRQRRRLGALPGALGDGDERQPGRRHQRLLRSGDDCVRAPGVGLERHRPEARDRVDDGQCAGLPAHGEKRLEVADDPGRGLRVDEEHGPAAALGECSRAGRRASGHRPTGKSAARRRSRTPPPSPATARRTRPCETARTRSPGESRLTIADSNAPVPDAVRRRISFSVRYTSRSRSRATAEDLREVGRAVVEHGLGERA